MIRAIYAIRLMVLVFAIGIVVGAVCAVSATPPVASQPNRVVQEQTGTLPKGVKRIEFLRKEIRRHDHLYHTLGRPEISNHEYDLLVKELEALEAKHPELVSPDSPTQRLGQHLRDGLAVVNHATPMLSIDKIYSLDEIDAFVQRIGKAAGGQEVAFVLEPKVDGVAVTLRYEKGVLVWAATRGNGNQGNNISEYVRKISAIPQSLEGKDWPEKFDIRGELYWPRVAFAEFNRGRINRGLLPLANSRNGAAGAIQHADPSEASRRGLAFIAHGFGSMSSPIGSSATLIKAAFARWGVPTIKPCRTICTTPQKIRHAVKHWRTQRNELGYDTDGIVIKVDSLALREKLGATRRAPRWCVAYKYESNTARTILRGVRFSVGRFGTVTPVAQFDAVKLSGVIVSRASLHNTKRLRTMGLRKGDAILVKRAGGVIPQVVSVVASDRPDAKYLISPPTQCPSCRTQLVCDNAGRIFCPYRRCQAQLRMRLEFFATRDQMAINQLGSAVIDQLVKNALIKDCADIYSLKAEQFLALDNVGESRASKIMASIDASKQRGLGRVLAGLSIRHVGPAAARALAEQFGNIDSIMSADVESLDSVKGIGSATATSVRAFFQSSEGRGIIVQLKAAGVRLDVVKRDGDNDFLPLAGKAVVVTGRLKSFTRKQAIQAIGAAGGVSKRSVTKATDCVVVGDRPGRNLAKAKELGVMIINEAQFKKLLRLGSQSASPSEK